MDVVVGVITPLMIVLGVLCGGGAGVFFLKLVQRPSPEDRRARERKVAEVSARKAVDETMRELFPG